MPRAPLLPDVGFHLKPWGGGAITIPKPTAEGPSVRNLPKCVGTCKLGIWGFSPSFGVQASRHLIGTPYLEQDFQGVLAWNCRLWGQISYFSIMLSKLLIIGKYLISLIRFQPRFHNIMKLGKKDSVSRFINYLRRIFQFLWVRHWIRFRVSCQKILKSSH